MTHMTLGQVRIAHHQAIRKMGKDRLNGDNWYRDDFNRPICVIGHLFAELQLDVSAISDQLNGQFIGGNVGEIILAVLQVTLTPRAKRYLVTLQELTDAGATWGQAYDSLNEEG